jgi:hypothetical protein
MNAYAKLAISKLHIATAYETGVVLTADQAAELYVYLTEIEMRIKSGSSSNG